MAVIISNDVPNPQTLTVVPGTKVTWTNRDAFVPHTVTATGANKGLFSSSALNYGQTFSYTFDKEGTYQYMDIYKPALTGWVIVKAAS
jgi:plastocyanin